MLCFSIHLHIQTPTDMALLQNIHSRKLVRDRSKTRTINVHKLKQRSSVTFFFIIIFWVEFPKISNIHILVHTYSNPCAIIRMYTRLICAHICARSCSVKNHMRFWLKDWIGCLCRTWKGPGGRRDERIIFIDYSGVKIIWGGWGDLSYLLYSP